ncbi:MAG: hypothetical protein D6713_08710, partial [Deltaproteobacteria bacterium]
PQNPIINELSIDPKGRIWVSTQNNGLLVIDDKLNQDPGDDEYDPLDVDDDGDTAETYYINTSDTVTPDTIASDRVTGVAFQESTGAGEPIVFISHRGDLNGNPGGVTRIDLNETGLDRFDSTKGLTVYREDPAVPPEDETDGPASNTVVGAFADASGNIWFPTDKGASRFGNAGVLSLDETTYFNYTAVATVTLEDDGLNIDPATPDRAIVYITSSSDDVGIVLILDETGPDTGIFTGEFGFTEGPSGVNSSGLKLLHVEHNDTITVTYHDVSPPGDRTATATWKRVYPFKDTLIIEGCFIATAAYGSYAAPAVRMLREFRDRVLLKTVPGRILVSFYYAVSPPLARFVRHHPVWRGAVRVFLLPVATAAWAFSTPAGSGIVLSALLGAVILISCIGSHRKRKRRVGN